MKRLVVFLFLLVGIFINNSIGSYTQVGHESVATKDGQAANIDFQYACNGKPAQVIGEKDGAGIDFQGSSFENGALLWSDPPSEDAKIDNAASITYRSRAKKSVLAMNIRAKYVGDGKFSIVDFKDGKKEVIYPINGTEKGQTCKLREIPIGDAQRFISDTGYVEVHFSVLNGEVLDLESIEIEYKDNVDNMPEVKIVPHYDLPPDFFSRSSYYYFHHGPIWFYLGDGVYAVYDRWWYHPDYLRWVEIHYPVYYGYRYYHYYDPIVYVQKEYIYVNPHPYGEHHHSHYDGRMLNRGKPEQVKRSVISAGNERTKNLAIIPVDSSKQGPVNLGLGTTKPTRDGTKISPVGNIKPAPKDSGNVILPTRNVDPLLLKATTKQKKEVQASKGGEAFVGRSNNHQIPSIDQIKSSGSGKPTRQKGILNRLTGGGNGDSQPKETRDNSNTGKRSKPGFFDRAAQVFGTVANTVFDTGSGSGNSAQPQAYLAPSSSGNGNSGSTSSVVDMKKRPDPPPAVQSSSDEDDKNKNSSSGNSGSSNSSGGGKKRR